MKFLRHLRNLLDSAVRGVAASPLLYVTAIGIIVTTFTTLGGAYLIFSNVRQILTHAQGGAQISVYFVTGGERKGLARIQEYFCIKPFISSCTFRSASKARESFLEMHPALETAVASLEKNPFPASVEIAVQPTFEGQELLKQFVKELSLVDGVEAVDDGGEWIRRWIGFVRMLDWVMWVLGSALVAATAFIVSNTIILVVHARRTDVEILRLVGATNGYIRAPFILEGIFQGTVGAVAAVGILKALYWYLVERRVPMEPTDLVFQTHFLSLSAIVALVAVGAVVGMFGSVFAVGRYLRS